METWQNINLETVPPVIKAPFLAVRNKYVHKEKNIVWDGREYLIRESLLLRLKSLFDSGKLNVGINPDLKNEDIGAFTKGFKLASTEEEVFLRYKITSEAYFWFYIDRYYTKPFLEGYYEEQTGNSVFDNSKDDYRANKIFGRVYKKNVTDDIYPDLLDKDLFDVDVVHPNRLSRFAKEEGRFVRDWEEVLGNHEIFVERFEGFSPTDETISSKKAAAKTNSGKKSIYKSEKKYWFRLAILFAEGRITWDKKYYFFDELTFPSERAIVRHVGGKSVLGLEKPNSLRGYVYYTLLEKKDNLKKLFISTIK